LPELTQAGGANDRQGPLSADWNCGEPGSTPLLGPSWPAWPSGSGKLGTPCACMHLAKARVKVPEPSFPWPAGPLPDETFPGLEELGLLLAVGPAPAPQPVSRVRLATAMITMTSRTYRCLLPRREVGIVLIWFTVLISRTAASLRRFEAERLGVQS
jgi:hypothetical protein